MSPTTYGLAALALWVVGQCVYNVFFHPLRGIPGPMLAGISRWWLFWLEWKGNPHVEILELHRKYGMSLENEMRSYGGGHLTYDRPDSPNLTK